MKHQLSLLIAAACAGTVPFGAATTTHAAVPAADPVPTVVKHVTTDVDGDGTRDSVSLTSLGSDRYELAATTTRGVTASVVFSTPGDATSGHITTQWYGADALDGHKGSELIVGHIPEWGNGSTSLSVYTWRSGKLVAEAAPSTPKGRAWVISDFASPIRGYRFFTSHGHRYVDASWLKEYSSPLRWKGTITRSVWRDGRWVKLSTRSHTTRTLRWGDVGVAGPRLLIGQVKVDVTGDGRSDLVSYYRDGLRHYLVKVATGSKVVEKGFAADGSGFIGAAALDGVAGDELMFTVSWDDPTWLVLTWRSGKLVGLPAPALYGGAQNLRIWSGASDESVTNLAFTSQNGLHYATTGVIASEEYPSGEVRYAESVWRDGKWSLVAQWTVTGLTTEQQARFRKGFTVDDLVAP